MPLAKWWERARELPGAPRTRGLGLASGQWRPCASDVAASGGRLLAMWASACGEGPANSSGGPDSGGAKEVYAAFLTDRGLLVIEQPIAEAVAGATPEADYPGIEDLFPCASRIAFN